MSSSFLPAFRQTLDVAPTKENGQAMFIIRDREDILQNALLISPTALLIGSLLDGRRTSVDVQRVVASQMGVSLNATQIEEIVQELAKAGLLETDGVRQKRQEIVAQFISSPTRPAYHQDSVYPARDNDLRRSFEPFFEGGPGRPLPKKPTRANPPLGLVAPHIDFQRGGAAYAWAYRALAESPPPDVIVGLGVAHVSPPTPFALTPKQYETPFGSMDVDDALYQQISDALWYDPRQDEVVHRTEHSLEFQAVWLRYLWGTKTPPWVPILCSSFERFSGQSLPASHATLEGGIVQIGNVLRDLVKKGRRVLILAGIDLAHVGPRFGDDLKLGPDLAKRVEAEDRRSVKAALQLDADAFYASVIADDHWRKVCGLSALYTALRWIKAISGGRLTEGELLAYGQAPDPAGGLVSFTSLIFPGAPNALK